MIGPTLGNHTQSIDFPTFRRVPQGSKGSVNLSTVVLELLGFKVVLKLQWTFTVLLEALTHPGVDLFRGAVGKQLSVRNEIDLDIG